VYEALSKSTCITRTKEQMLTPGLENKHRKGTFKDSFLRGRRGQPQPQLVQQSLQVRSVVIGTFVLYTVKLVS
jgi:hypothetical protein